MAGLGLPKFSRNANTVPSPGDLSDVERLEDFPEADFRGMTLSLSQETTETVSPIQPSADQRGVDVSCLGSTRCRAGAGSLDGNSGSIADNASTASTSSIVRQFSRELSEEETKEYFSVREGAVEKAAEQCSPVLMKHLDGELRGVWLLTEIDHWDTEKERLLFLTDYSLIVLKYDFITLKLLEYRRLHLKTFDVVQVGLLTYPNKSFMPKLSSVMDTVRNRLVSPRHRGGSGVPHAAAPPGQDVLTGCGDFEAEEATPLFPAAPALSSSSPHSPRNQEGVRCMWDQGTQLPVLKDWNPWCREIPWVTFTSHHLRTTPVGSSHHDVGLFSRALVDAMTQLDAAQAPPASLVRCTPCRVLYEPIVVCSYLGVAAAFHNTTQLGFFKARGKVSF
ncbi:tumor protein p63-regulated gene 1 protein-like isoform X1 [Dermacentor silvarum]|uniref:tumor protein p63-regulated gene 1 protein-like isoform X1 n=1 Tax=Dermacentor silvarum TaxID=543639 RepID=UPI00189954EB|nr:tumor protein p63-regulated gene 1 protein-like isoform X1 [Dermacentor silvarum]